MLLPLEDEDGMDADVGVDEVANPILLFGNDPHVLEDPLVFPPPAGWQIEFICRERCRCREDCHQQRYVLHHCLRLRPFTTNHFQKDSRGRPFRDR